MFQLLAPLAEPLVEYGIPALIGGYSAASKAKEQGQGPLQQATAGLLGGGLSIGATQALKPVLRFAGTRILGIPAASGAGTPAPDVARKLRLNETVAKLGSAALGPEVASRMAAGATGLGGTVAPAAVTGASTYNTFSGSPETPQTLDAIPPEIRASGFYHPQTLQDVLTGPAAVNRLGSYLEGLNYIDLASKEAKMQYPFMNQAKKDEMQRQLAAAQYRANVAVNSDQILSGLHTAQEMGRTAASQMGQVLGSNFQYG